MEKRKSPWLSTSILMTVGFVVFLFVLFRGVMDSHSQFHTFTAPGTLEVALSQPGEYMIFHEYDRTVDSKGVIKPDGFDQLVMMLNDAETGDRIDVEKLAGSFRTNIRRVYREAEYSFSIANPTTISLEADYNEAGSSQQFSVAVGRYLQGSLIFGVVKAIGVIVVFGIIIALLWVRAMRAPSAAAA